MVESMDVCGERETLASELGQVLAMARELEARVAGEDAAAARELCREMASAVGRSIRLASSCHWPDSPAAAAGTGSPPRGDGAGNATARDAAFKKRKGMAKVRSQVRVTSVQDVRSLDDGLSWRKYGQKDILGAKYPRAYFRCTYRHTQGCQATKQVQRTDGDPLLFDVVYHGAHTCAQGAPPPTLAGAEPVQLQHQLAGQEQQQQSTQLPAVQKTEEMAPFLFPSTPAGTDNSAVGGYLPYVSPENSECHGFAACDPVVDMDFETRLDEFLLGSYEFLPQ